MSIPNDADIDKPLAYVAIKNAICHAMSRPECVKRGLNVELHLGRKQVDEVFGSAKGKWPRLLLAQPAYLVDCDSSFRVMPKGCYKNSK